MMLAESFRKNNNWKNLGYKHHCFKSAVNFLSRVFMGIPVNPLKVQILLIKGCYYGNIVIVREF